MCFSLCIRSACEFCTDLNPSINSACAHCSQVNAHAWPGEASRIRTRVRAMAAAVENVGEGKRRKKRQQWSGGGRYTTSIPRGPNPCKLFVSNISFFVSCSSHCACVHPRVLIENLRTMCLHPSHGLLRPLAKFWWLPAILLCSC